MDRTVKNMSYKTEKNEFSTVEDLNARYSIVKKQGLYNVLDKDTGEFILEAWVRGIHKDNDKYVIVKNKLGYHNLARLEDGAFMFWKWFDRIYVFNDEYAIVSDYDPSIDSYRTNLISFDTGEYVSSSDFETIEPYNKKYAKVGAEVLDSHELWGSDLLSYETGELVFNKWFESDSELDDAARQKGIYKSENESRTRRLEGRMTGAKTAVCECCGRRFSVK